MLDDLLFIANALLSVVDNLDLSDREREYIIKVARKVIFTFLIELSS